MSIVDKISGLDTADNPLSGVKEGSLKTADNVVIRSKNVLEPRRGQALETNAFASSTANAFAFFNGGRVVHHGTTALAYATTGAYTAISGSFTAPDAATLRMKFTQAAQNLYFTTNAGIYGMDVLTSAPRKAGVPKPLQLIGQGQSTGSPYTLYGNPNGTDTWLPKNSQVAYRMVFVKKDTHGTRRLSEPTGRYVVTNPDDITTNNAITGLQRVANVVTATFASKHRFYADDIVLMDAVDGTFLVGPHTITSVNAAGTTFTYTQNGVNASSTVVHTFTSGLKQVNFQIVRPADIDTTHLYQMYRSAASPSAGVAPSDEMYLVYEGPVPAITELWIDSTPEISLYSTPLYTNELTGEGALQANTQPPLAKDTAFWSDRVWYANTVSPHRVSIQMLGTSAPGGVQSLDTITVGANTYTFGVQIAIYASTTPSENIAITARRMCARINVDGVYKASYVSGENDAPGRVLIEEIGVGGSSFTVTPSRTTSWNPSVASQTSDNDTRPNRVFYSKVSEPEAVPLLNYVDVGPKNKAILRVVPSREKLFVFKEDAIYTVSGNAPNLRVDLLDNTAWLLAPDSVVAANNQIFALTNQGVVAVTEGGVRILSRPVEDKLEQGFFRPIAAGTSTVKAMVWGAAYESEHQYILGLTTSASSTTADQILVYNYLLDRWTRWPVGRKFAAVNPTTDVLWLASASTNQLISERKTFTHADYVDGTTTLTITAVDATARTVTVSSTTGLSVGDGITDASGSRAIITAINGLVLTLVAVAASGAVVGAGHILDASTVALWRFNDTTATALVEEKGLYPGASSTGTPTVVTGQIGSGKHLSTATITTTGANDTFRSLFGGTAWTVEWWMRLDSIGAGLAIRPIMSMSSGFNSDTLRIQTSATGRLLVGSTAGGVYVGDTLSLGVWKHYALTRVALGGADGSSVRYKLWENGVYTPANGLSVVMSPTATPLAGQQIVFGNSGESAGSFEAANCMLDDVRISNAVRTDAEILESYQRGSTGSTLSYFETSSATGHAAIPVDVEFNPVGGAAPGTLKQFKSTTLHFNYLNIYDFDATCRTELSTTEAATAMTTPAFAIYTSPYENVNVRLFCPLEKQRATLMRVGVNVSEAWSRWQLNGFTVDDDSTSDRNSR